MLGGRYLSKHVDSSFSGEQRSPRAPFEAVRKQFFTGLSAHLLGKADCPLLRTMFSATFGWQTILGDRDSVPFQSKEQVAYCLGRQGKVQAWSLPVIKGPSSLHPWDITHWEPESSDPPCIALWNWDLENQYGNADALAGWNAKYSVLYNPGKVWPPAF